MVEKALDISIKKVTDSSKHDASWPKKVKFKIEEINANILSARLKEMEKDD
jgi:ribosomal protein S3AE